MKTLRTTRRLEWDILEGRRCPSLTVGTPTANQPIERFDPVAETERTIDLAMVQAGQASNVVFLGDSITQFLQQGAGASVWSSQIAPLGAADLGVGGDTTNNLLWRIENGELAGQPRVAVLLIGTNNLGFGESAAQTVAGIEADIAAIHAISPRTEILLNGLFPRGLPTDSLRAEILEVNADLSSSATSLGVVYTDPGANLVMTGGSVAPNTLPDLIHPDDSGYEIWANGILGTVQEMLAKATTTTPVATTSSPTPSAPDEAGIVSTPPIEPATTSPTQGTPPASLDAPASVASTPPAQTPSPDPSNNVVPPVVGGHSALLRVAQSTTPAPTTSDLSD
jgi:lysophospholipase L1-like esterase